MIHYLQLHASGKFRQYEEGLFGSVVPPPEYNLTNVVAPVYLHYGANDWPANPEGIPELASKLGGMTVTRKVPLEDFNHFDFLYAKDAVTLLYNDVIKIIGEA